MTIKGKLVGWGRAYIRVAGNGRGLASVRMKVVRLSGLVNNW